jgi:hypothetical protein
LAQGPDEKFGFFGRKTGVTGAVAVAMQNSPLQKKSAPVGGRDPAPPVVPFCYQRNGHPSDLMAVSVS